MCGVYLRVFNDSKNQSILDFDSENIKQIALRGPDELVTHENVNLKIMFGFSRLAIRSLNSGKQPFIEERFTSAFNGEVYNYDELKTKIESTFPNEYVPESDTHTLGLFLFLFGPQSISDVIGMFAGYLQIGSKIYAYRDRVGEKPLYYGFYQNSFFISSNLPKAAVSNELISDFTLISGLPSDDISQDVLAVSPGTYLEIELENLFTKKNFIVKRYWNWPRRNKFINKSKLGSFESTVVKSIESQLVSDVGMSVLLSGGVDSGIVAAIARKEFGTTLQSFTLAFKDSGYSEASQAIRTAHHLDLKHEIVNISFEELASNVNQVLDAMDIPIFDTGALSLFSLCKKISSDQKVSLTGDGGDELFRGYRVFDNALALSILSNIPLNVFISFCIDLIGRYGGKNDSYIGAELMLRRARSVNSNRTINPLFGAIGPLGGTELFDLVSRRNDFSVSRREIAVTKKTIEIFFIKEVLPKIYLAKSDRMSMSNGLELRSPLLDYRVIESAFGFSEINFYFKSRKQQLKKIASKYLPSEVINAKKHGFSTPFHKVVKFMDTPNWQSPQNRQELILFNKIWFDAKNGVESAGIPAWSLLVRENFYRRQLILGTN